MKKFKNGVGGWEGANRGEKRHLSEELKHFETPGMFSFYCTYDNIPHPFIHMHIHITFSFS